MTMMVTMARPIVGKAELAFALGYSRGYFFRLVHQNRTVLDRLEKIGYKRRMKSLSPLMLEAICEYYGYPDCMNK